MKCQTLFSGKNRNKLVAQDKGYLDKIFLISQRKTSCRYLLELSHQSVSNGCPKCVFIVIQNYHLI